LSQRATPNVTGWPAVSKSLVAPPDQVSESGSYSEFGYSARVDLSFERALKRLLDLLGSALLMVLFAPVTVMVLIGAAVNGQSPFFRQQRVGRDGKLFDCLKFQTMVPNAEEVLEHLLASDPDLRAEWDLNQKLKDDPRVTPIGRFLRACSLDELPQLWNVIKGDMSLVGPRPIMRSQVLLYGRNVVAYKLVRPGVTGLWQVSGRNLLGFRKRVAMDVVYVRNQSLLLDLWILAKTVFVVLARHGAY
jgi:lipopolysaccharide/colanic/teichoic acid biosynthesis glycosyltransferase